MRQWRLIYDHPTTGAGNMARDEAILRAVAAGNAPPTLRLYAWEPPCLSLGYGQRVRDVDQARLRDFGWDLVRRPTGGRALLHTDELTYSLALPLDHPVAAGSVVESYQRISAALLAALNRLGAQPRADRTEDAQPARTVGPVCFETPAHYEITLGGRKLIGSAQLRRRSLGGLLQHGTLPLTGDLGRICAVLAYPDEVARSAARRQVRARAITLEAALNGRLVGWLAAADAVAAGFAETFAVDLVTASLSSAEIAAADALLAVYAGDDWNGKR
ncbi:MAG: lipoate--protein ligase family protein [Chloroflexi bacterium]|nr:lipoate--protein ligase family protein [Chloroflexota bacterium]